MRHSPAMARCGSARKCNTMTQNAASTLRESKRQLEGVALAKFDVAKLPFLSDGASAPQHLMGKIDADHLAGKTRQLKGQAAGAATDIGERKIARQ